MIRLLILALLITTPAFADKLCIKKKQAVKNEKVALKKILRTGSTCPSGYIEVLDTSIFQGPSGADGQDGTNGADGAAGSDGQDGMDAAWGDGSAGARVVSANEDLDDDNLQFTDFTVNSGVTLTVPSGTIIRCTGTATINGTIQVETAGNSASVSTLGLGRPASQGFSTQSSGNGEVGDNSNNRQGGYAPLALDSLIGRSIIRPPVFAGGAGGGGYGGSATNVGQGGGGFAIYCQGGITVSGTGLISANGGYGGNCQGGGAGGIIILASAGTVDHSGPIRARGNTGGAYSTSCAQGGGGGGGLIHILAQTISGNDANLSASGGGAITGAQGAGTVTSGTRSGGGAGGSLFGAGGNGSLVAMDGATLGAFVGSDGLIIKRQGFNPAGML